MKLQSSRRFVSSSNAQASLQMWSDLRQTDYLLWFLRARGRHVSRVTITTRSVNIETSPWWFKYFEWKLISTVQSSTFCDKATLCAVPSHVQLYLLSLADCSSCRMWSVLLCRAGTMQHCSTAAGCLQSLKLPLRPTPVTCHLSQEYNIEHRPSRHTAATRC